MSKLLLHLSSYLFAVLVLSWWPSECHSNSMKVNICSVPSSVTESNPILNPPFALRILSNTENSATIDWLSANIPVETAWEIELVSGSTTFTGQPTHFQIVSKPFSFSGLQPGVTYRFKIRATEGANKSAWSNETAVFNTFIINGQCGLEFGITDNNCTNPDKFGVVVSGIADTVLGRSSVLREVRLIIEHDWLIDLEITLESPSGKKVRLVSDNGGTNDHFGDPADTTCQTVMTLLNAASCGELSIKDAAPPFTGRYLPLENLNEYNDLSNPNGIWKLHICDDGSVNVGILRHIELVFQPVQCFPPSGFHLIAVDSTSALLDWAPGGFCENTRLEFGPVDFMPGTGQIVITDCPPFLLTGLTGGSTYEVLVYEDCGLGIRSGYACERVWIQTNCSPPPLTILEDFDTLNTCSSFFCTKTCSLNSSHWFNTNDDDMDWLVHTGTSPTSLTGPPGDVSGTGNYIYMETTSLLGFGGCSNGSQAILYSNCFQIDTRNTDSCHLSFSYNMNGRHIESLRLEMTTDGRLWQPVWSKSGNQGEQWKHQKISLADFNGQTVQFRFIGIRGSGDRGDIALDEIAFFGSVSLGTPGFLFFLDADADGFGDPDQFISSCFDVIPNGYVSNNLDCRDNDPRVNLVRTEIPCNGIDENCNGLLDDLFLPALEVRDTTAFCQGEPLKIAANTGFGGSILWFDSIGNLIHLGDTLDLGIAQNLTDSSNFLTYFVSEISGTCFSVDWSKMIVVIHPKPELLPPADLHICTNNALDLRSVPVIDVHQTEPVFSYHSASPASVDNEISSIFPTLHGLATVFIRAQNNYGCTDETTLNIFARSSPSVSILPAVDTLVLCRGMQIELQGQIEEAETGYQVSWNTFETSSSIRVNTTQSGQEFVYIFRVTNPNLCSASDSILVKTTSSVDTLVTTTFDVSNCDGFDGSILIEPVDGLPPFTYYWSGPVSGNVNGVLGSYHLTGLTQGSYSITVEDSSPEGCPFVRPFLVINGPSARVSLDETKHISCHGANDGIIRLNIEGNSPIVAWSNGANTSEISDLSEGTYSVTVTDGDCQTILTDLEVREPDSLVALAQISPAVCHQSLTGKVELMPFGGTAPLAFEWNNGSHAANLENVASGVYAVTITDANGCQFSLENLEVTEPQQLVVSYAITNPTCFRESTGAVETSVQGGMPPYQLEWSNGTVNQELKDISAGNYHLTVTDISGCRTTLENIQVIEPDSIEIEVQHLQNVSCPGSKDGIISVTGNGGNGSLTFVWNNGLTEPTIDSLSEGVYWVQVGDEDGCIQRSETIRIEAPPFIELDFQRTEPTCQGRADGALKAMVIRGGFAPFQYVWSNGQSGDAIRSIGFGYYALTVTDQKGCSTILDSVFLNAPQVMTDSNLTADSPICHGSSDGQIFSNILGGTLPYKYAWNSGHFENNLQNLPAGNYQLSVTDDRGCTLVTDTIRLLNPLPLSIRLLGIDSIACHGDLTGGIHVEAQGGAMPYKFLWNGGQWSGASITGLSGGIYALTVEDNRGCRMAHRDILLPEPAKLSIGIQVKSNSDCTLNGGLDTILTRVNGGTPPFSYQWSNGENGSVLIGMGSGEYTVSVVDKQGCFAKVEKIKVNNQATAFREKSTTKNDISCHGAKDGNLSITFDGGVGPFQYLWSNGAGAGGTTNQKTLILNNLDRGLYQVTVVDQNGCFIHSSKIEIREPEPLDLFAVPSGIQDVTCHGGSDGRIQVTTVGGNSPYQYSWFNRSNNLIFNGQNPSGLPAGQYKVRVVDANNCRDSLDRLIIREPDSFYLQKISQTDVACRNDSSGSIQLVTRGGTPPYDYFWNNGQTGSLAEQLVAGFYRVTIVDEQRCVLEKEFEIKEPDSSISIKRLNLQTPLCFGDSTGQISFQVEGGTPGFSYLLNDIPLDQPLADHLSAGNYLLTVIDNRSCQTSIDFSLEDPLPLELAFTIRHVSPGVGNDGSATVTIEGGRPPYDILWNTGEMQPTIRNLQQGRYSVTATDVNGCETIGFIEIELNSSVDVLSKAESLLIFPNPTGDHLFLQWTDPMSTVFRIYLVNTNGQELGHWGIESSLDMPVMLDLSGLSGGIYWLQFLTERGERFQRKVVKLNSF